LPNKPGEKVAAPHPLEPGHERSLSESEAQGPQNAPPNARERSRTVVFWFASAVAVGPFVP
jgi:hypothetical protein